MVGLNLLELAHRNWTVGSAGLRQRIEDVYRLGQDPPALSNRVNGRCVGGDFEWVGSVWTISTPVI